MVLRATCRRPHCKIPDDSLSVLKSLRMCHLKKSRNSSNLITIHTNLVPFSNVVFLLEMTVQFRDFSEVTCTETFQDCERIMGSVGMGFLETCYQYHCRNDVCPQDHWHTIFSKRNATFKNLCFFWRRV